MERVSALVPPTQQTGAFLETDNDLLTNKIGLHRMYAEFVENPTQFQPKISTQMNSEKQLNCFSEKLWWRCAFASSMTSCTKPKRFIPPRNHYEPKANRFAKKTIWKMGKQHNHPFPSRIHWTLLANERSQVNRWSPRRLRHSMVGHLAYTQTIFFLFILNKCVCPSHHRRALKFIVILYTHKHFITAT